MPEDVVSGSAWRQGPEPTPPEEPSFLRRVLIVAGVASGCVAAFLLLWYASGALLILFGGLLLAVFLRGLSELVSRYTRLPEGWALAVVLVGLVVGLGLTGWYLGREITREFEELSRSLIAAGHKARAYLQQYDWGQQVLDATGGNPVLPKQGEVVRQVTDVFNVAMGWATNALVVLFVGVFVAAQHGRYRRGLLHLVPFRGRGRAEQVLDRIDGYMRRWLLGRVLDMTLVAAVSYVGLYLLRVPMPLALSLVTFLLVFIPYLGPVLAAVPAILVAAGAPNAVGGEWAPLYVGLLYLGIQTVESYTIQPMIEDSAVDLPPAVTIAAQVLMGVLAGGLGVTFATPLAAVAAVLVKELYVRDALDDPAGAREKKPGFLQRMFPFLFDLSREPASGQPGSRPVARSTEVSG